MQMAKGMSCYFGCPARPFLLRASGPIFIDSTLSVPPIQFPQAVIIMVYDAGTSCFVSCVFALLMGKNEWLHRNCIRLFENEKYTQFFQYL
ncbi:hypothetical protein HZS_386 [Henneguya salminicola]|nr:hypothetical protein HZS_386 [Henneguya salminicola]